MSMDVFLALAFFSLAASVTPGPNNLMVLASGVNFGFLRSVPHMLGIAAGFSVLIACVGLGLGALLAAAPGLFLALKIACAAYLVYLAWRIAVAGSFSAQGHEGKPLGFLAAAAFQWVNPKAWFMALTAISLYTSAENYVTSVAIVVATFVAFALPCVSLWCGMGTIISRFFADPARLRAFNVTMALLLVASLWPMVR